MIDGRDHIVDEIASASVALRDYVRSELRSLVAVGDFRDALSGALPPDGASQAHPPAFASRKTGKDLRTALMGCQFFST